MCEVWSGALFRLRSLRTLCRWLFCLSPEYFHCFSLFFCLVSCLACNVPLDFSAWDRSVYWIRWHFAAVAALQFVPLPDCLIASFQLGSAVATAIKSPFSARELQKNKKNLSLNVRPFTAFPPPMPPNRPLHGFNYVNFKYLQKA